jgi:hypothetical protein
MQATASLPAVEKKEVVTSIIKAPEAPALSTFSP